MVALARYILMLVMLLLRGFVSVAIGLVGLQLYMMVSSKEPYVWEWDLLFFLYLIFCFLALPVAYLYEVSRDLTLLRSVVLGGLAGMAYPSMFVFVALTEELSWGRFFSVSTVLGYGLFPGLIAGVIFWGTGSPLMDVVGKRLAR